MLLQIDRLQLTAVYCNRRGGVKTTPQKTRFCDVKYARIWDTDWVDDDRTKSDYNILTKRTLQIGIAYAWWNEVDVYNLPAERWDVRHQWQRENQDQHKAHETRQWRDTLGEHVNVRVVVSLRSLALSHSFLAHIAWLKAQVRVFVSSHPCMKWASPLTSLISSSPSSSFSHSSSTSSISCYTSTSPRLSSKIPCATSPRRWGQPTSPSPTRTHWRRRQTGRQAFSFRVIDSSSVRVEERLTDNGVVVVQVLGETLLGCGLLTEIDISLCEEVVVGLITCGGVLFVLGTRLLSGSAHGCCPLTSREVKRRRKCWKLKIMKRRKVN